MTPTRTRYNLDRWLDDEIARTRVGAYRQRRLEQQLRDERLCTRILLAMLLVCCAYLAFTVASDTQVPSPRVAPSGPRVGGCIGCPAPREESRAQLSAAAITAKGNLGRGGGVLRVDVVSSRLHRPSQAVRFRRPQPDSDSLLVAVESSNGVQPSASRGALSRGGQRKDAGLVQGQQSIRLEAARVGATSALPIPSLLPCVEIQHEAVLDANSGAGRPAIEPALLTAHGLRGEFTHDGGVTCDRPRESETRSSIARWSDSAVPRQATASLYIASGHLAVGEPNMSRLFWRRGREHRAVAVGARIDDYGGST